MVADLVRALENNRLNILTPVPGPYFYSFKMMSGCVGRRPDIAQPWQAEQAKLLWAQGQPGMALRLARALLADAPRWSGRPEAGAERASLLSRTGKWIAQSRCALLCLWGSYTPCSGRCGG